MAVGGRGSMLAARDCGRLVGVLPFFRSQETEHGVVINSLPWFGSHGGCLVHRQAPQKDVRRSLLSAFAELLAGESNLLSATLSLSPFEEPFTPLYKQILCPQTTDSRTGQLLRLPTDNECGSGAREDIRLALLARMKQKARNSLYKGIKQGFAHIVDNSDESWKFLYETHCVNMAAINGTPKLERHFEALRAHISPQCGRLHLALHGSKPVAAMYCLHYAPSVEYMIPVVLAEYRSEQPLPFLIHSALLQAVEEGYSYWNFGGTWHSQATLHRFKEGFGATDHPYSYMIMTSPAGLKRIRRLRDSLSACFPGYYIYPYYQLSFNNEE